MLQEGHLLPGLLFSLAVLPPFPGQTNRLNLCFEGSPKPRNETFFLQNFYKNHIYFFGKTYSAFVENSNL